MSATEDPPLPAAMAEAHEPGFDFDGGDGVDFEPYERFMTADETVGWWRSWTGDASVTRTPFRVFGQDGSGGLAAFWLVRPGAPLERQPVVFLGSEGETAVVASDLGSYLWLLAGGFGPLEATMYPKHEHVPREDARLVELAGRHAAPARRPAADVIAAARAEFPDFDAWVKAQCR